MYAGAFILTVTFALWLYFICVGIDEGISMYCDRKPVIVTIILSNVEFTYGFFITIMNSSVVPLTTSNVSLLSRNLLAGLNDTPDVPPPPPPPVLPAAAVVVLVTSPQSTGSVSVVHPVPHALSVVLQLTVTVTDVESDALFCDVAFSIMVFV